MQMQELFLSYSLSLTLGIAMWFNGRPLDVAFDSKEGFFPFAH